MPFNPDVTKKAQDIIFSWKKNDTCYPSLYFNNAQIQQSVQKHLGLFLDEKPSLLGHINVKIRKATVGVNLICKLKIITIFVLANRL